MKLLRTTIAALLLGTATLAVGQTTAESFADQLKQMQTLQSFGTYTFKPAPTVGNKATDPIGNQSFTDTFSDMQALSSNSGKWNQENVTRLAGEPADPVGRESFGTMFSRMQAESSNSDEWKRPPSEGAPAYATADTAIVASEPAPLTFAERIAHALHLRAESPQSY
jgi:hypothetical protein